MRRKRNNRGGRFQSVTNKGDEFRTSQEVKLKDIIVNVQRQEKKKRNKIINGGNGVFGGMLDIFNQGFGELIFHLQSHLHFTLLISYIYSTFTQLQTSFKHYTFPQRFPHFPSNLSIPADPEFGGH